MRKIDFTRIAAFFFVAAGIAYFYLNLLFPAYVPTPLRAGVPQSPFNLLILGTDVTYDRVTKKPMPELNGRADTIIFARIDPRKEQISLLSIPRDTMVEIPGYGKQKINFANAWGGSQLTRKIVERLVRREIDYYVELQPDAVAEIVDAIGGITLNVPVRMRYRDRAQGLDIDLQKGWQRLSGKQAHDYIRYRDNFRGDILRIENQQTFFKSLGREIVRPGTIIRGPFILHTTLRQIKTDMPFSKTFSLLNLARMLPPDNFHTFMAPGDVTMEARVGSVWVIDDIALDNKLVEYF